MFDIHKFLSLSRIANWKTFSIWGASLQNWNLVFLWTSQALRGEGNENFSMTAIPPQPWLTCWDGFSAVLSLALVKLSRARGSSGTEPPSQAFDPGPGRAGLAVCVLWSNPRGVLHSRGAANPQSCPAPPQCYPGLCSRLLPSLACDPSTCHQESFAVAAFRSKKVKVREKILLVTLTHRGNYIFNQHINLILEQTHF